MNVALKLIYLASGMLLIPYFAWSLFRAIKEMQITLMEIVLIILTAASLLYGALRIYTAVSYDGFMVIRYTIGDCPDDPDNQCGSNMKTIFTTE